MEQPFVSPKFKVPTTHTTGAFHFGILAPDVTELDYQVVMSSKQRLRSVFAEHDDWPSDEMTLEDNRADLKEHQRQFYAREAFAYTVRTVEDQKYMGCVYLDPCKKSGFDAEVYLWVSDDCLALDHGLYQAVQTWINNDWPFKSTAYPGRGIPWVAWRSIPLGMRLKGRTNQYKQEFY